MLTNSRNPAGVKWSSYQYRTFGGEHYVHRMYDNPEGRVDAYRSAGVKCRRVRGDLVAPKPVTVVTKYDL